jgi:hypothetical protein
MLSMSNNKDSRCSDDLCGTHTLVRVFRFERWPSKGFFICKFWFTDINTWNGIEKGRVSAHEREKRSGSLLLLLRFVNLTYKVIVISPTPIRTTMDKHRTHAFHLRFRTSSACFSFSANFSCNALSISFLRSSAAWSFVSSSNFCCSRL